MNISLLSLIQIWIILYSINLTEASIALNRLKNSSETGVIDLKKSSEPVLYNLDHWLASLKPEKKYQQNHLIILPVLAILAFLWMICLKVCKWIREDSKFDERGCSYDVTSFVILSQQDEFDDLDISNSNAPGVYDTVTSVMSVKGLQSRIDHKMYDTVTSYASFKKQNSSTNSCKSPVKNISWAGSRSQTPEKDKREMSSPTNNQFPRKGRFYVVPAIDNYLRLKNTKDLSNSFTSSDFKSEKLRRINSLDSLHGNQQKTPKRSESDGRLSFTRKTKLNDKKDAAVQVMKRPRRTIKSPTSKESVILQNDNSPPKKLNLNDKLSRGKRDTDQHTHNHDQTVSCDKSSDDNKNMFYTKAIVHTNGATSLHKEILNENGNFSSAHEGTADVVYGSPINYTNYPVDRGKGALSNIINDFNGKDLVHESKAFQMTQRDQSSLDKSGHGCGREKQTKSEIQSNETGQSQRYLTTSNSYPCLLCGNAKFQCQIGEKHNTETCVEYIQKICGTRLNFDGCKHTLHNAESFNSESFQVTHCNLSETFPQIKEGKYVDRTNSPKYSKQTVQSSNCSQCGTINHVSNLTSSSVSQTNTCQCKINRHEHN